ncbi:MAG: cyclic nucleotide-binding domain-containing protein [Alphaproteobacteria bacterium]|nr:cyclic nucleotide-binding domain-containing protein [Alphaproteobacteria bacterium]MCB9795921.1 cyclic nucleotide-binding domain-containing protein [Alphaproteobacteria bacterium]
MSLLHTLGETPEFETLSEDELRGVEAIMSVKTYKNNHIFIREGEPGDTLYLILDGEVLATRKGADGGLTQVLARMGPGDLFGILALIDDSPRAASCQALGTVVAASLPRARFDEYYQAEAPAAYTFQHMVALQLVHDVRVMNQALVKAMLAMPAEDVARELSGASYEYRNPEVTEEVEEDQSTER